MRNHAKLAVDGPAYETWKLGYFIDVIYLRDLWMHRVDVHHALGRPLELDADHDGRIVADVVAEWARRHGRPFAVELIGRAGGRYAHHPELPEADVVSVDAVEFCRTLAGRKLRHGPARHRRPVLRGRKFGCLRGGADGCLKPDRWRCIGDR